MTRINLLPWREKYIEVQNRRLGLCCVLAIVGSMLVCIIFKLFFAMYFSSVVSGREYLRQEIFKSEGKMKEVSTLLSKKDALVKRMQIIEGLQFKRNLAAKILDGIALALPHNITVIEVVCHQDSVKVTGLAASNEGVSKYMSALQKNLWVAGDVSSEVKTNDQVVGSNGTNAVNRADTSRSVKFVIDISLKVA